MNLTEQCKEDFEKWYRSTDAWKNYLDTAEFFSSSPPIQWGVIQDFADSVGYEIGTVNINGWIASVKPPPNNFITWSKIRTNDRQEARTAAIEKFNEIYNNESK